MKDKRLLKVFLTWTCIVLGALLFILAVIVEFNLFIDWNELSLGGEVIIIAILGIIALGAGFGLMLAEAKLRKLQYDIEEEELNKKEAIRQAEEVIEQLNENVWEKYE